MLRGVALALAVSLAAAGGGALDPALLAGLAALVLVASAAIHFSFAMCAAAPSAVPALAHGSRMARRGRGAGLERTRVIVLSVIRR